MCLKCAGRCSFVSGFVRVFVGMCVQVHFSPLKTKCLTNNEKGKAYLEPPQHSTRQWSTGAHETDITQEELAIIPAVWPFETCKSQRRRTGSPTSAAQAWRKDMAEPDIQMPPAQRRGEGPPSLAGEPAHRPAAASSWRWNPEPHAHLGTGQKPSPQSRPRGPAERSQRGPAQQ